MARDAPERPARLGIARLDLHLVGEHEVGDVATDDRGLARHVHQLGVGRSGVHGLGVARHVGERPLEVDVLERTATLHLRRDLTRQRQDGRSIDLGVVETGQQVRRAGPGDREARREVVR